MILHWFLARSSRVTGPKMRVADGLSLGLIRYTQALPPPLRERIQRTVAGRAHAMGRVRTTIGFKILALLHAARAGWLLTETTMVSQTRHSGGAIRPEP